jgi:predicted RNA-binding Zn-ribbon protein involved in translation (DUF1610 family)
MRGYNAQTLSRLARLARHARHDPATPIDLGHFLTRCNRASTGRYETADSTPLVKALLALDWAAVVIAWFAVMLSGAGGLWLFAALLSLGLLWLTHMAIADIRIARSVRRARHWQCSVCAYQIAPPPDPAPSAPLAATTTCPECGEEVIVGRATDLL